MTDKHDKLVALLRECGAEEAVTGLFYVTAKDIAAFAAAHVASLCADVEPVAFMFQHSETGRIAFVDAWQKENGWALANPRYSEVGAMHGASTVAAITAQRDQALARVAELEAALRTADHTFAENGILASHAARQEIQAALTKGQP